MSDTNQIKTCSRCGSKKETIFCNTCRMDTPSHIQISISETVRLLPNLRMRTMKARSKKFLTEFLSGWFPSVTPKLPDGVHRSRIVNREKDEYHEVVKKYGSEEIIHECHEPLSRHRKARQRQPRRVS